MTSTSTIVAGLAACATLYAVAPALHLLPFGDAVAHTVDYVPPDPPVTKTVTFAVG